MQEVQQDQLRVLGRDLGDYRIWPYKGLGTIHNSRRMAERNGSTIALVNLVNRLRSWATPSSSGGDSNTWFDFACRKGNTAMHNAAGGCLFPCRRRIDHKFVTAKVTPTPPDRRPGAPVDVVRVDRALPATPISP